MDLLLSEASDSSYLRLRFSFMTVAMKLSMMCTQKFSKSEGLILKASTNKTKFYEVLVRSVDKFFVRSFSMKFNAYRGVGVEVQPNC